MVIHNATRRRDVCRNAGDGRGWWLRLRGLMFRRDFGAWDGLWLDRNNAIHMFFVRFAIDLVWLDRDLRVVGLREAVRPWRLAAQRGAHSCLELPAGSLQAADIHLGDQLEFRGRRT